MSARGCRRNEDKVSDRHIDLKSVQSSVLGTGDVLRDIAIFVEGWFVELFMGGFYDAELEKTRASALFVLLLPGMLLLWYNLVPFFRRGTEFRVESDGSVAL